MDIDNPDKDYKSRGPWKERYPYEEREIEVTTLEDLLNLITKYGDNLIINKPSEHNEHPFHEIEIYDDYRE